MIDFDGQVRTWLQEQQGRIDEAISRGASALFDPDWSAWEIDHGLEDLRKLNRDQDCPYDRPSIGAAYALWYHGRRTQSALRVLGPWIANQPGTVRIIDLGCGTGALACAVGLLLEALNACGEPRPKSVLVEGVDTSPFMIQAANRIFEAFGGAERAGMRASFEVRSWGSLTPAQYDRTLVAGGYLLDHSDGNRVSEVAERLDRVSRDVETNRLLLYSSQAKLGAAPASVRAPLLSELDSLGWDKQPFEPAPALWEGSLHQCHKVRNGTYRAAGGSSSLGLLERHPFWRDRHEPAALALKKDPGAGSGIRLFTSVGSLPDEAQEEAATPDRRLTVIVGAAGSGKSIVLSERIVRTIREAESTSDLQILVTAFNKAVVDLLASWVKQRLEESDDGTVEGLSGSDGSWRLKARVQSRFASVVFLHRDILPREVLGAQTSWVQPGDWEKRIELGRKKLGLSPRQNQKLSIDFLDAELERVIYGLECHTLDSYLAVDRVGRGLALSSEDRRVVWQLLNEGRPHPFVDRRMDAYRIHASSVKAGSQLPLEVDWSHVFVDECQDFTPTDFQLLARIPPDPAQLVAAGDESQSVHLGTSYRRPRIEGRDWRIHRLTGSYRVPLRICDALEPLARRLVDTHSLGRDGDVDSVLIESRKAAVPGPRPIVVEGGPRLRQDLTTIFAAYGGALSAEGVREKAFLAECDRETSDAVESALAGLHHGLIKRDKGLEWPCVIFSNATCPETDDALDEWLFTLLTRATTLLVLVVWPQVRSEISSAIGSLDPERLLFWDQPAESAFAQEASSIP